MGSFAPVRRTNNRRAVSPTEDYDSLSKQSNDALLPLHHRHTTSNGNGSSIPSVSKTIGKRKRARRPRKKVMYICGVPVDVPVVGVVTILFGIAMLLVIGSTSLLHASTAVRDNNADHLLADHRSHQFEHHFERHNSEQEQHGKHNSKTHRHLHQNLEEDSIRLNQQPQVAEEPEAVILPSSPIRVVNDVDKDSIYDVVVAGAGPSGLSSALFASRAGLRVHVLGSPSTGLLSQTKHLDNFPSFFGKENGALTGPGWLEETLEQAKSWGATFGPPGLLATSIERQRTTVSEHQTEDKKEVFFSLSTGQDVPIRAWSVIVATGATPRKLNLAGEDALWGNSLHSCAICDGHLYQGSEQKPSTVLVVGGGDAALDAALLLARYATKVVLVHRREEFTRAHNLASLGAVRATTNIEIMTPYTVEEWITKENDPSELVGAKLSSPGKSENSKRHVHINGAFVMIGASPNTQWMDNVGVALDDEGLIQTTANLPSSVSASSMITASSVPGLFAAGEVTDNIYKQAITAAAAGAQAAIDAERWLREQRGVTGSTNLTFGRNEPIKNSDNSLNKMEPVEMDVDGSSDHGKPQSDEGIHTPKNCKLVSEDCIRSIVKAYPVVVFSKPWCPYCRKALEALSLAGLSQESEKLLVIDLSKHDDSQDIQSTLQAMTGRRTVPNVFIGGKSIGGGDETRSFQESGKLVPLLKEAGALGDENVKTGEKRRNVQQEEPIQDVKKTTRVKESNNQPTRHSSSETESCDLSSEDCVREIVNKYPVVLFSLSWCPECKHSLQLLDLIGVTQDQIHIIDLDDYAEIALDIRANMKALSGRRSVPNLFVGGENFGGYQKTSKLRDSGDLEEKFRQVGVL